MERQIVVRGEGEVTVMPDLASVRLAIEGEGGDRETAYRLASEAAGRVDEVLRSGGPALGRVTTASVVVQPLTRWRKGETIKRGWRASRMSLVEIVDLTKVGDLLALLTEAGASVGGLSWELASDNQARGLARRRAGEDARARALEYASALGLELGEVEWVSEPGLRSEGSEHMPFRPVAMAAMAAGAAMEPIEIEAAEITTRAAVEVGFSFKAT